MTMAKKSISADDQKQLRQFFEETPSVSRLLTTLRSRRVGQGYKIETGDEETHPITGRKMKQERGPLAFAYIDYCVEKYGQCPVYNNSLECNFGAVVHHLDTAFYEQFYSGSAIPTQVKEHMQKWH